MSIASRVAARVGVAGALLLLLAIGISVSNAMTGKHLSLAAALMRRPSAVVADVLTIITLIAFAIAGGRSRQPYGAWVAAGVATLAVALRGVITTHLGDIVNPIHVFAASMWIGTLFVLVVAGISAALSGAVTAAERGPAVAVLVHRFSTIALWSAGVLVLTGITRAYLTLRPLSALWTSIYGQTLIVKLCVVACVFALGAYNNRRLKPLLGTEPAASRVRRSASFEIALAAVVLGITAVLVNLPTPEALVR